MYNDMFDNASLRKQYIQLSDGRTMSLEDLIKDYERLQKKVITAELKVGEWFLIDKDVIFNNIKEIHRVCNEAGDVGKEYWKRFKESNKIADAEPERYTRRIWTYIFGKDREYIREQTMRDMCKNIGDGMCDEVICDFELQMRICNGESANDLFKNHDKLPCVRVIRLRNGKTGFFGGGAYYCNYYPPASLSSRHYFPNYEDYRLTPYAFRRGGS